MKLRQILLGGAALLLVASCSDDLAGNNGKDATSKGDGYIAVKINLPQTKATRALNDKYDDGSENEYEVKSTALLIFQGEKDGDPADAIHTAAYDLGKWDYYENDHTESPVDNVTDAYQFVKTVGVKDFDKTGKTWGLVLVNYKGIGKVSGGKFELSNGSKTVEKIGDLTDGLNTDLANFTTTDGFFMANIPASENRGSEATPLDAQGKAKITLLIDMTQNLYDTPEEARNNPSANFYVERAVAKTTVHQAEKLPVEITATLGGENPVEGKTVEKVLSVQSMEWLLSNTEPTSYIVRNLGSDLSYLGYANPQVDEDLAYRMVGSQKLGKTTFSPSEVNLYRTYWCMDPAYATESTADAYVKGNNTFTEETKWNVAAKSAADATAAYCHENTFDVAHMSHNNTTRVVLKVKMNGGDTFYTVNERQDLLYTNVDDVELAAVSYIAGTEQVRKAIEAKINTEGALAGQKVTVEKAQQYLKVGFTRNDKGYYVVETIGFKDWEGVLTAAPELDAEVAKAIIADVNKQYRIAEYLNGYNYYDIYIKHFAGNEEAGPADAEYDLAKWNSGVVNPEIVKTTSTSESYPENKWNMSAENNWLGRYGMVRNNWYDINVTAIKHLGTPEINDVTVDTTPDDEKDEQKWVAFTVNVLSWAKRTQSVVL